jgi:ferredoxin/flavodoxin---NADP+ reductase
MNGASPRAAARRPTRGTARIHRVLHIRELSAGAFVLRFSREGLSFTAGQWLNLGLPGARDQREYSVYSTPSEDFLEVLVKEIPGGAVSGALHRRRPGDALEVEGPHGSFCLVEGSRETPQFLFLATGTGISPFHCFVQSAPGLDYRLLHGVRTPGEMYDHDTFDSRRLVACLSGAERGPRSAGAAAGAAVYPGRLTTWLAENPVAPRLYCYLCGNSDMIYEAYALLRKNGIHPSRIFAEVYF